MPQFSSEPPQDEQRSGLRLIRTPAAAPIHGYVISNELSGCPTHFANNRTQPCETPNCPFCESGIGWRWHGYFLALIHATQETVIFEITAYTSDAFKDYFKRYGSLRGAAFKCARANGKSNGRVLAQLKPADLTRVDLPRDRNIRKLLCHIWNVPYAQLPPTTHQSRPPATDLRVDRSLPEITTPIPKPSDDDKAFVASIARQPPAGGNGRNEYPDTFPDLNPEGV